jgi:beta-lactamase regulating signal transducer with metallopeptidase domain
MTAPVDLTAIAHASAARIVYCLVEGVLITAFAAFLLRLLRRQDAGTRFAVWFSALLAIAALPLFGGARWSSSGNFRPGVLASHAAITLPSSWALYLFGAWAVVAALALARVAAGLWHLLALRRSCETVDIGGLHPVLRETLTHCQGNRSVAFCVSERVHAPIAIGFASPAVVIPKELIQELTSAELQQILLHEFAHLRRWDDWTNLAQKIVKAVLFFHPAVWWLERRVSLEREMACDDFVLKETASPKAYAQCLARLAEKNLLRRSAALAQAAVSRLRQTSLRVARILDVDRRGTTTQVWRPAVLLVAMFSAGCLALVARAPRLVAFEDITPKVLASAASVASEPAVANQIGPTSAIQHQTVARMMRRESASSDASRLMAKATRLNVGRQQDDSDNAHLHERFQSTGAGGMMPTEVKDSGMNNFVASEAFFVLVEGSQDGSPSLATYQVTVWHVTLLRLRDDPTPKASLRKVI